MMQICKFESVKRHKWSVTYNLIVINKIKVEIINNLGELARHNEAV